jgi:predicted nucleic acid-binding protein
MSYLLDTNISRGSLKRLGIQRNAVDLMIAAVALAHDLTLVSRSAAVCPC